MAFKLMLVRDHSSFHEVSSESRLRTFFEWLTTGSTPFGSFIERVVEGQDVSFSGHERDKLFLNLGGGRFADVSPVSGMDSPMDGRALVAADFDNDGHEDLFIREMQGGKLLRNQGKGNWVRLVLEGRLCNRDAVGAQVRAWLPPGTPGAPAVLFKSVQCGGGFTSSSDKRLLFGLGAADRLSKAEIRWPSSGLVQLLGELPANRTYKVVEGRTPVEITLPRFALGSGADRPKRLRRFPEIAQPKAGGWRVVNLWSVSCAPCLQEMPDLERISRQWSGRVRVIGLAVEPQERQETVREMVKRLGVTYDVAIAEGSFLTELYGQNANITVPATYVVDPEGYVRFSRRGPITAETLARQFEKLPLSGVYNR